MRQRVARSLLNDAGDALSVMRRERERAQDQKVERSLSRESRSAAYVSWVGILPEYYAAWVECQQEYVTERAGPPLAELASG